MSDDITLEGLVAWLYDVKGVKFGSFTLKSGIESPVYFDLRVIVSYPPLLKAVSEFLWKASFPAHKFHSVCGVPYTALPLATCMSVDHNVPMLIRRKEAKDYGTKKMIEGHFNEGDVCLVVEDVVTTGSSVLDTVKALNMVGIVVKDAAVLLDREQGGAEMLKRAGIELHSVCTMSKLLDVLEKAERLSRDTIVSVKQFVKENTFKAITDGVNHASIASSEPSKRKNVFSYGERSVMCAHPVSRKLFSIMETKKTNLALSADVASSKELLELADEVGPFICLLKTHVDIIEDFTPEFVKKLTMLSEKHQFLIFEDRKFADIGNTVQHQYKAGIYNICEWAHIINCHTLPGPGIIDALRQVGKSRDRACLLIGQMSSKDNLFTQEYTDRTIKLAENHPDFVIGFISTSRLSMDPTHIHMTPGVKMGQSLGDNLGQEYLTPEEVILNRGCDVIIVGRGILSKENRSQAAQEYQQTGYQAYKNRIE